MTVIGVGATRPLPRDRVVEELHGDPTVWLRPKVLTQRSKRSPCCLLVI